jgi:hypothetical protein
MGENWVGRLTRRGVKNCPQLLGLGVSLLLEDACRSGMYVPVPVLVLVLRNSDAMLPRVKQRT